MDRSLAPGVVRLPKPASDLTASLTAGRFGTAMGGGGELNRRLVSRVRPGFPTYMPLNCATVLAKVSALGRDMAVRWTQTGTSTTFTAVATICAANDRRTSRR